MAWALTLSAMFGVSRQSCGCASNPHGVPVEVVGASKTLLVGHFPASLFVGLVRVRLPYRGTLFRALSRFCRRSFSSKLWVRLKPSWSFTSKLWVRLKPSWRPAPGVWGTVFSVASLFRPSLAERGHASPSRSAVLLII